MDRLVAERWGCPWRPFEILGRALMEYFVYFPISNSLEDLGGSEQSLGPWFRKNRGQEIKFPCLVPALLARCIISF